MKGVWLPRKLARTAPRTLPDCRKRRGPHLHQTTDSYGDLQSGNENEEQLPESLKFGRNRGKSQRIAGSQLSILRKFPEIVWNAALCAAPSSGCAQRATGSLRSVAERLVRIYLRGSRLPLRTEGWRFRTWTPACVLG
jgi:hypothetical protein